MNSFIFAFLEILVNKGYLNNELFYSFSSLKMFIL